MNPIWSAEALRQLFDDFAWFECGSCPSLSPPPGSADMPERVELVLRDFGTGGLMAGDLRTYQSLRLTATGLLHDQVTVLVTRPDWPVWS